MLSISIFVGISILCAWVAHVKINKFIIATLLSAFLSSTFFQLVGYIIEGFFDPFFIYIFLVTFVFSFIIALFVGALKKGLGNSNRNNIRP